MVHDCRPATDHKCLREHSTVGHTALMTILELGHKLYPAGYSKMSTQMGAILEYLLERVYTTPALVELMVTPEGLI